MGQKELECGLWLKWKKFILKYIYIIKYISMLLKGALVGLYKVHPSVILFQVFFPNFSDIKKNDGLYKYMKS